MSFYDTMEGISDDYQGQMQTLNSSMSPPQIMMTQSNRDIANDGQYQKWCTSHYDEWLKQNGHMELGGEHHFKSRSCSEEGEIEENLADRGIDEYSNVDDNRNDDDEEGEGIMDDACLHANEIRRDGFDEGDSNDESDDEDHTPDPVEQPHPRGRKPGMTGYDENGEMLWRMENTDNWGNVQIFDFPSMRLTEIRICRPP